MKWSITIDGREHAFELNAGETISCALDGEPFDVDAVELSPGLYSILIGGRSFEVRAQPAATGARQQFTVEVNGARHQIEVADPRAWAPAKSALALAGRQQITAPMPGKVVRVLAAEGRQVEAGEGLLVVEAMKMQNEVKSPKAGTVEKILVKPGQAVNAGETLLVIE